MEVFYLLVQSNILSVHHYLDVFGIGQLLTHCKQFTEEQRHRQDEQHTKECKYECSHVVDG